MELKLDFKNFILQESEKDVQKDKENAELKNKDASHGDKPEHIMNEDDKQKDKENAELKNKDASHGDQPQKVNEKMDEDEDDEGKQCLDESFKFDFDANKGKSYGEDLVGIDGIALKTVTATNYLIAYKDKNSIVVKDSDGSEIRLDQSAIDQIVQLKKRK